MRRMRVKQPHPEFAFDFLNFPKQRCERRPTSRINRLARTCLARPQVHPVIGRILADQVDFADAFAHQSANFGENRFRKSAAMLAAHLRNYAKTARVIAAFGNFYVSEMRRCKPETGRIVIGNVSGTRVRKRKIRLMVLSVQRWTLGVERWAFCQDVFDDLSKLADLIEPNKCIHLRHLLPQFFREPLRHAAAYDQFLMRSSTQAALLMRFQNRSD